MRPNLITIFFTLLCLFSLACNSDTQKPDEKRAETSNKEEEKKDIHSYATPQSVRVKHMEFDWDVLFEQKAIKGSAILHIERIDKTKPLVVDTRGLKIEKVEVSSDGSSFTETKFELGKEDPVLGASLTITLKDDTQQAKVYYSTGENATALQWLDPPQTAGKKYPFLFTQSQSIHARSWIPIQDSPGIRITYKATVRTPKDLLAIMSAKNDHKAERTGTYTFEMNQPIAPYLVALAVGDLVYRPIGERSGVYAEPVIVEKAAKEFEDTEKMIAAAEKLYGKYRWEQYDVLILPPSFPYGGMENPRLTFVSPALVAGDKSLVSVIAHELAHSWSGNLVTNATWRDFWLNEGFTSYVENRIQEEVYGKQRADMEALEGRKRLDDEMAKMEDRDEILHIDLNGRDPEEGSTGVPYEKGSLFLRHLETTFGRESFDKFLKGYFDHYSFKSLTTGEFEEYLTKNLLDTDKAKASQVPVKEWLYKPGVPVSAPKVESDVMKKAEEVATKWAKSDIAAKDLPFDNWSNAERVHFLRSLPKQIERQKLEELDKTYKLTQSENAVLTSDWLIIAVRNNYEPAYPRLEQYLTSMGRRLLIRPIYEELAKTPEGKERAKAIYVKARPTYHPIAVATIDGILK
ncbi:MAG: M1 family metallopeptidase [Blastocatellia bacterium]|nr:M1 family metallopeptidase [Blastocatellia bacterium]